MKAQLVLLVIRELVLSLGIAVLIPFIAHYIVQIVYPHSSYELLDRDNKRYQQDRDYYKKIYFYITAPLGLGCLMLGALIPIPSVGAGFILGGLVCLTAGYYVFWNHIHNVLKLLSLVAGLIIILVLSYWFFRQRKHIA